MLDALLQASPQIQIHAFTAFLAIVLGAINLLRKRRDLFHRLIGYLWIAIMTLVAVSSFFINEIRLVGTFGPIHLLSVVTLYFLASGVLAAMRQDIVTHQRTMKALYFWSLGVAGMFTLVPGRIMGEVVFGGYQKPGFFILLIAVITGIILAKLRGLKQRVP